VPHFEHIPDELCLLGNRTFGCAEVIGDVLSTHTRLKTFIEEEVDAAYGIDYCRYPDLHPTGKEWHISLAPQLTDEFLA